MALALFSSCQMHELDAPYEEDFSGRSDAREVIITASLADVAPETKTLLERTGTVTNSKYKVYWLPGDKIRIFSAGESGVFTSQNTEPSITAPFKGSVSFVTGTDENGDPIYAWGIYPSRSDQVFDASAGTVQTYLPPVQAGKADSYADDIAIMLGRSTSLSFAFKNAYSGLRVMLGSDDIVSMSLRSNGGEALAGRVTFGLDSNNKPVVQSVSEGSSEVTLYAPDGNPFESGKFYYFVTLPDVALSSGITLTLRRKDGTEGSCSVNAGFTLERNLFSYVGGNLDEKVTSWQAAETQGANEIWYTSRYESTIDFNGDGVVSNTYTDGRGVIRFTSALTAVPDEAFLNKALLTSVILPDVVETIGASAFKGCSLLASVTMGDRVTTIMDEAFASCSFESVDLPGSLESIGSLAFAYNTELSSVTIPESVTSMDSPSSDYSNPFAGCTSLQSFSGKYASDNHRYLYTGSGDMMTILSFAAGSMEGSVFIVPDGFKTIAGYAFAGAKLNTVDLNTVNSIQHGAFYGSAMKYVTLPSSVASIGPDAFSGCTRLESIRIEPIGASIPTGSPQMFDNTSGCPIYVPSIYLEVFRNASSWSSYSDRYQPWVAVSDNQFFYTATEKIENDFTNSAVTHDFSDGKGTLTFANPLTSIPYQAFYNESRLKSIILPETVTSISVYAFYNCTSLSSVYLPDGITSIGYCAFENCSFGAIHLPESLSRLDYGAFYSCKNLESVTIPQSVTSMGYYGSHLGSPFINCKSLSAFYGKYATDDHRCLIETIDGVDVLVSLVSDGFGSSNYMIPDGVKKVAEHAISGSNIRSISLNEVEYLAEYSFSYGTNLNSITIPASLSEMAYKSFDSCTSLSTIRMNGDTPPVISGNGTSFTGVASDFKILIPGSSKDNYYNASQWASMSARFEYFQSGREIWFHGIGNDTSTTFDPSGDFGANYIETFRITSDRAINASLPSGLDIGAATAPNMAVAIFDGPVTSIGAWTFCPTEEDAGKLDYISIPTGVRYIRDHAFNACINLLNFPHTSGVMIAEIGDNAFMGCAKMTAPYGSLDMWTCQSIGDEAFYGCESLASVRLAQLKSLGIGAFEKCTGLTSVLVDGGAAISKRAFYGCTKLASVTLDRNVTGIGEYAFYNCKKLTEIRNDGMTPQVLHSVKSLGGRAFYGCESLTTVSFPDIQTVGVRAFGTPKSLQSIHFGPGLKTLSANLFYTRTLDYILNGVLEVYFEGTVPPQSVNQNVFMYQNDKSSYTDTYNIPVDFGAIHVPSGCKDAYVAKLGSVFEDKIVADL